jgi:RimJ/RimL family protein N-acetyltransferase
VSVDALQGSFVRLEPVGARHVDGLVAAANEARGSYAFTTVPSSRHEMAEYVGGLVAERAAGESVAFAQVRLADRAIVGCTRFLNLRAIAPGEPPYAVEIGGTWLAASAQGTAVNPEAKLLLLSFAFDTWRVERVDLQTDARNERSRAGILSIGARYEGTLRSWQPSRATGEDGKLRDSAIFSILSDEWPEVRAHLERRIERRARDLDARSASG